MTTEMGRVADETRSGAENGLADFMGFSKNDARLAIDYIERCGWRPPTPPAPRCICDSYFGGKYPMYDLDNCPVHRRDPSEGR